MGKFNFDAAGKFFAGCNFCACCNIRHSQRFKNTESNSTQYIGYKYKLSEITKLITYLKSTENYLCGKKINTTIIMIPFNVYSLHKD